MTDTVLFDTLRAALWITVQMSMPLLGVGLIVGLVVGLFQALTSIQENTLTFVPKVAAMLVVFWVSMSFMTSTLLTFFTATIGPMIAGV
jgi:flagellar biosynthetic protein FliQ